VQHLRCLADVHHQAVGVEFVAAELAVDDEGGAMQALGRAEDLAAKLWAIMMWSRTQRLYMGFLSV
jgi:hypothetical protein